jgi:hypothetical protein
VAGNVELDAGLESLAWWKEHTRQGSHAGGKNVEEKHLEIAKTTLNKSMRANQIKEQIASTVEDTLVLFVATMRWHDYFPETF